MSNLNALMIGEGAATRAELLRASDAEIVNAVSYAEPMILRAILYQLLGDEEVVDLEITQRGAGIYERNVLALDEDVDTVRFKAVEFLKAYRDAGAGEMAIGPRERIPVSLQLAVGLELSEEYRGLGVEELGLDPWARSLAWTNKPSDETLAGFSVIVIGAGMAGLNAAMQLKRAGIPFRVLEKNDGVGGTWHETRYPGARLDTPSRNYTHLFAANFGYLYNFCPASENKKYFEWVADTFDVRKHVELETEVVSLTWHEDRSLWAVVTNGPNGRETSWANAIVTGVGFLNRPKVSEFKGAEDFKGESWHSARWPEGKDLTDKRVAVIGTGATGYQLAPQLALETAHVTVFQRTPAWLLNVPGYLKPLPDEMGWLDRNLPYHANFLRFRGTRSTWMFEAIAEIDPNWTETDSCSAINKKTRDVCMEFMREKISDPEMIKRLTPNHPVLASRPIAVDADYCFFDAIQRDNFTLVSSGVAKITPTGVEALDGSHHEVDVIVYATGFHATEYMFPMDIYGRDGKSLSEVWAETGAQGYLNMMVPGFPNFFMLYGPNSNGGLPPAATSELGTQYALRCIEHLLVNEHHSVDVTQDAYVRWTAMIDKRNESKVWSDSRADNYYWSKHGRSATMNPLYPSEMWAAMKTLDTADLDFN